MERRGALARGRARGEAATARRLRSTGACCLVLRPLLRPGVGRSGWANASGAALIATCEAGEKAGARSGRSAANIAARVHSVGASQFQRAPGH